MSAPPDMVRVLLGLDGVDAPHGGCTTHFAVFLLKRFEELFGDAISLRGLPALVRLNPFIPWKTRGNAAVGLELSVDDSLVSALWEETKRLAEEYVDSLGWKPNGLGLAMVLEPRSSQLEALSSLYERALTDVVDERALTKDQVIGCADNVELHGGAGVVGALAALGFLAKQKKRVTYELVLYRAIENVGKPRLVDEVSVGVAEASSRGRLINNYNYEARRAVAVPRGPDPVLLGLRGLDIEALLEAASTLRINESIWGRAVFVTNQHTDAHALPRKIRELRIYRAGLLEGVVSSEPEVGPGGHVSHELTDGTGAIDVMYYAPAKPMSAVASRLKVGDLVRVLGGAVPRSGGGAIFNAQKLWLEAAAPEVELLNPRCPGCGARLKSAGSRSGYKCERCKFRSSTRLPMELRVRRRGERRLVVTPGPGRLAHLVEPASAHGASELRGAADLEG